MYAFDDHLDIIKGDLLNQPELERVIEGRDAVLSAFGTRTGEPRVQGRFATALRKAMMQTGVRRVALMSTSFLFQDSIAPFIVGRLFFRRVMTDASEMEGVISAESKISIGRLFVQCASPMPPTPDDTEFRRATCLLSVSQSRVQMWLIS